MALNDQLRCQLMAPMDENPGMRPETHAKLPHKVSTAGFEVPQPQTAPAEEQDCRNQQAVV